MALTSLKHHASLAGGLAATCGAVAAAGSLDDDVGTASTFVLAIGIVGGLGVLAAVLQAPGYSLAGGLAARTGLTGWWQRITSRSAESPRAPVHAFHAALLGGALAICIFASSTWAVAPRLFHIDDPSFARGFALVLLLGILALALGLGIIVARLLIPLVARLDARLILPWPSSPAARWIIWVLMPATLLLAPYLVRHYKDLGVFAAPFWLVLFVLCEVGLARVFRPILLQRPSVLQRIERATLVALFLSLLSAVFITARSPDAAAWARRRSLVGIVGDIWRSLTDVDRDGFSSVLGGGDCAAFDAAVNPGARDVPQNGLDEDCDGEDAEEAALGELERFSGRLPAERIKNYNLVVIIVDAMRADHTGVGGYRKRTTPYIDALADESLVFSEAYSQSSATMLSIPSMLAGRDPSRMEWTVAARIEPAATEVPLATRLAVRGYTTGIVAVSYFANFLEKIKAPYEHVTMIVDQKGRDDHWYTGRAGPIVVAAIRQLEQMMRSGKPIFLTVYIPDPHAPYDRHSFGISAFGRTSLSKYDGEIANSDRQIGFLLQYLKYSGLWDDTVVVVTSDHGEEFQEHGGKAHARTCYGESTHVPLVVRIPGIPPQEISQRVGLVDVVPTIVELIGGADGEDLHGQSLLVPALAPSAAPAERLLGCAVVSQRASQGNYFIRSVRSRRWLLIHHVLDGTFELYHTETDSGEQNDLWESHQSDPEVAALREYLIATLSGNLQNNLLTD